MQKHIHPDCRGADARIGAEIGMLHNLFRRQMACMTENSENLTGMQAMLVHHLIMHEDEGDLFQKDIETAFQMRRSTATGILQLMEQHDIIRREPVEHDGRLKRLVLTDRARAMDEHITERMEQMEQILRQGITEDELKGWFAVCEKIRSNLEQYQCKLCREGQNNDKKTAEKRA